jgi:hypothetical protein
LNKRSSFLDQARLRPPQDKDKEAVINTLIKAKSEGLAENTQRNISEILSQLSRKTNLKDPAQVKNYIANATKEKTKQPLANATKNKLCLAYEWYCKANNLTWQNPSTK